MKTAGARKKTRGRPRHEAAERHPCGKKRQPTPAQIANQNRATVVAQRIKHSGISQANAETQEGGSVIGRLFLMGATDGISRDQYEAAARIAQARHDAGQAVLRPMVRSGSDFGGVGGHDDRDGSDAEYVAWVERANRKWREIRSALLMSGSLSMMAVEAVVIEDKEPRGMLGDLRIGLNAVARLHSTRRS